MIISYSLDNWLFAQKSIERSWHFPLYSIFLQDDDYSLSKILLICNKRRVAMLVSAPLFLRFCGFFLSSNRGDSCPQLTRLMPMLMAKLEDDGRLEPLS